MICTYSVYSTTAALRHARRHAILHCMIACNAHALHGADFSAFSFPLIKILLSNSNEHLRFASQIHQTRLRMQYECQNYVWNVFVVLRIRCVLSSDRVDIQSICLFVVLVVVESGDIVMANLPHKETHICDDRWRSHEIILLLFLAREEFFSWPQKLINNQTIEVENEEQAPFAACGEASPHERFPREHFRVQAWRYCWII